MYVISQLPGFENVKNTGSIPKGHGAYNKLLPYLPPICGRICEINGCVVNKVSLHQE